MHVEALFVHDSTDQLLRINVPNGDPAPRFFLGHTANGVIRRYRHDVSPALRHELAAASASDRLGDPRADAPLDVTPFTALLGPVAPIANASAGLAFRFPASLAPGRDTQRLCDVQDANVLHPFLPKWVPDIGDSQPLIVRIIDGRAVAVCGSVRITPVAHEAGVETAAPFRGSGHAAAVVATWAIAVRQRGAEPLYSTSWQNAASRAVARKLALVPIGRDLHVT